MKKGIKFVFASLALAAVVSAGSLYSVYAEANAPKQAEAQVIELQNGAKLKVEGQNAFVIEADGSQKPAPDSEYIAKDGSKITTHEGKVVAN